MPKQSLFYLIHSLYNVVRWLIYRLHVHKKDFIFIRAYFFQGLCFFSSEIQGRFGTRTGKTIDSDKKISKVWRYINQYKTDGPYFEETQGQRSNYLNYP